MQVLLIEILYRVSMGIVNFSGRERKTKWGRTNERGKWAMRELDKVYEKWSERKKNWEEFPPTLPHLTLIGCISCNFSMLYSFIGPPLAVPSFVTCQPRPLSPSTLSICFPFSYAKEGQWHPMLGSDVWVLICPSSCPVCFVSSGWWCYAHVRQNNQQTQR